MKKIMLFAPLTLLATCLSSCGGINRIKYNEVDYEEFKTKLSNIEKAQYNENGNSTLFNEGTINFKYSLSLKGYWRIDQYFTMDNINLSFDGYVNFIWNNEKNYLRIDGPQEVAHYLQDANGKWWHTYEIDKGTKHGKYKEEWDEEITSENTFIDVITEKAEYQLALGVDDALIQILLMPTIKIGITGFSDIYHWGNVITPSGVLTDDTIHDYIMSELHSLYDGKSNGYFINQRYGSNDENSASAEISSKMDLKDNLIFLPPNDEEWEEYRSKTLSGYANVDLFSAWKDNFIYQNELKFDANIINTKEANNNLTITLNISEEVNRTSKIDNINLEEYYKDVD